MTAGVASPRSRGLVLVLRDRAVQAASLVGLILLWGLLAAARSEEHTSELQSH